MLKIGVLVSGGGTNLQALMDSITAGGIDAEIAIVISSNKEAYALKRAAEKKIPTAVIRRRDFDDQEGYEKEMIEFLNKRAVELVVLAGFMVVLGKTFVDEFRGRIINVHPSLIPEFCGKGYYGLKVHEAVLASGKKRTGATVHFVDEGTDTGPIILQREVEVKPGDTPELLQKRVMEQAEWIILPEAVRLLSKK